MNEIQEREQIVIDILKQEVDILQELLNNGHSIRGGILRNFQDNVEDVIKNFRQSLI